MVPSRPCGAPLSFERQGRPRVGDRPSQAVADQVHGTWVRFITGGDPGWTAYDINSRTIGLLTDDINEANDPAGDERVLWDGIR